MATNRKFDYEEYFRLQHNYEAKYGPKTVVIAQSGTFYYILEYDLPERKIGKAYVMRELIDRHKGKEFVITKPKTGPHQIDNPFRLSITVDSFEHYKITFLELGYTLVMYEQKKRYVETKKGTKKLETTREVTKILTKGTDIDRIHRLNSVSNKIVSLVFEVTKVEKKVEMSALTIGYAALDLISGKVETIELYGDRNDPQMCLLKLSRLLSLQPKELLIHLVSAPPKYYSYLYRYLELNKYPTDAIIVRNQVEKEYFRASYQTQILRKVYPKLTTNEVNHLSIYLTAGASLVTLLNYCNDHNPQIIERISIPSLIKSNNRLFISRATIIHLNLYDSHYLEKRREYSNITSLLSIIDRTKTHMGKRYLLKRLNQPYIDAVKINDSLSAIADLVTKRELLLDPITKILTIIPDIDLLHRKLKIGSIVPRDLARLTRGYINIAKILDLLSNENINIAALTKIVPNIGQRNNFKIYVDLLSAILDSRACNDAKFCENFIESEVPIFKSLGSYQPFQSLTNSYEQILITWKEAYDQILAFSDVIYNIAEKRPKLMYKNDRYYLTVALGDSKKITKVLKDEGVKIEAYSGGRAKRYHIYTTKLAPHLTKASAIRLEYQLMTYQIYVILLELIDKEYQPLFGVMSKFLSKLDHVCSGANVALKYNYVRPNIKARNQEKQQSYIKIKDLRHPIVERIIDDEFIPNDLVLGDANQARGMLLYGCNSSGKSTITKALGIAVILAQAGYYVPAGSCELVPYEHLITRLSGNDNMFAGDSSFLIEMKELRTILKYTGVNTLVLGDEMCRGTGWIEGAALTVDALEILLKERCNFIFSTHMHILTDLPHLKKDINSGALRVSHLDLLCDEEDELTYNRKLRPGRGRTKYGIEVARSVGLPKKFIERAYQIRKDILKYFYGHEDELLNPKRSRYSSLVYMHKCVLCDSRKDLVTHHIREQRLANDINYIGHVPKDAPYNLGVLCGKCHDMTHYSVKKINSKYKRVRNMEYDTKY